MDRNSIDVLFFGSSVAVNAFCPQEIYNEFEIRSYNLSSEQQSIFLSYYWLKEALRYQSPKVVILDTRFMWDLHPENSINTTEGLTRKCLDPMKWSDVKMEAVHQLCEIDDSQSELSYYLTNWRFHSRWSGMQEYDFKDYMINDSQLKGFAPTTNDGPASFTTYELNDSTARMVFVPLMQEYLDKTVTLCKENGIQLVMVSLPGNDMNDAANNSYMEYAKDNDVEYINLCSTEYYEKIGAVLPGESVIGHENIWGAIKMSHYIGELLQNKYSVPPVNDYQYEDTKPYYEQAIKNANLQKTTEQLEYLKMIEDPNYVVFITSRKDISSILNDELLDGLHSLGLKFDVANYPTNSYCAVIEKGNVVYEEVSSDVLKFVSSFRNGNSIYTMQSMGKKVGASSSVVINGTDYCGGFSSYGKGYGAATAGLNIIVYDMMTWKVIDRVTFSGANVLR